MESAMVFSALLCSSLLSTAAQAATLTVSPTGTYRTLQAAINAAATGDTISIEAGTYASTTADTKGKNLTISSVAGAASTQLTGNGRSPVINVPSGVVVVTGLTLSNPGGRALRSTNATITLSSSHITGSGATNLNGGGMHVVGGTATVEASTFSANTGAFGAHLAVQGGTQLSVADTSFDGGLGVRGGALSVSEATAQIVSSSFTSNRASHWGGAIRNTLGSTLIIESSTFEDNHSTTTQGGAISSAGSGTIQITGSTFTANSSSAGGGAIYFEEGLLEVASSSFTDNECINGTGGAIMALLVDDPTEMTINGSLFEGNVAAVDGGALYVMDFGATVEGSAFYDNQASNGGAIYMEDWLGGEGAQGVQNSLFQGNQASGTAGALLLITVNHGLVVGSSFVANSAPWASAMSSYCNGSLLIGNSAFTYNSGSEALAAWEEVDCTFMEMSYTGFWGNSSGNLAAGMGTLADLGSGNVEGDPLYSAFSDDGFWSNDDLSLATGSAFADGGNLWFLGVDGTRADLGHLR
jgi:predicted outer membrane repeat protein